MGETMWLDTEYVAINCGGADRGGCDVQFAVTRSFYDETQRTGRRWYCPNGHRRVWGGPTTAQQLEQAEAKQTALRDQLEASIRDAEATRAALLRDRHRFANGVCPCCNRSFGNVRRHMETKHPDYDSTEITKARTYGCSCGQKFATPHGLRIHQGKMRGDDWARPGKSRWASHLTAVSS